MMCGKAELKEQAKKFVKLFGGTGLPDFLFDETMRYIVGTAIVLCHGSVHPTAGLFIGSIKNGMGTNIMHSQPLITFGEIIRNARIKHVGKYQSCMA